MSPESGPFRRVYDASPIPVSVEPAADAVHTIPLPDPDKGKMVLVGAMGDHRDQVIRPVLAATVEEDAPQLGEVPRMPTLVTEVAQGGGEWEGMRVDGIGLVEQRVGGEEISVRPLAENDLPDDFLEALTTLSPGTPEMGRGNYHFPLHIYLAIQKHLLVDSTVESKIGSQASVFRIVEWTTTGVQAVRLVDEMGQMRSVPLRNFFLEGNYIKLMNDAEVSNDEVDSDAPQGTLERNTDLRFADVDFRGVTS